MSLLLRLAPFRNAFLVRGLFTWAGLRFAAAWVGLTDPNVVGQVWIIAVASLLVVMDARRRDEDLFLGNLGVPTMAIALMALPLPILVEALVL